MYDPTFNEPLQKSGIMLNLTTLYYPIDSIPRFALPLGYGYMYVATLNPYVVMTYVSPCDRSHVVMSVKVRMTYLSLLGTVESTSLELQTLSHFIFLVELRK